MRATATAWLRRPMASPGLVAATAADLDGRESERISATWALAGVLLALCIALTSGASAAAWLLPVLLAPLLEEAVFRVGLQESLLRQGLPPWLANGCTALCFTISHVMLRGAVWTTWAVLLPALALGVVYGRSRQLRGCVVLHALMNAVWIAAQQQVLA